MRERTDEDLMNAYAKGDMSAFELLYDRHRAPLYRYILRLAGDASTANDLYQGCWEKIIRARQRYNPSAPFRAWMYRIAHNHAMDFFRRRRPLANTPGNEPCATDPGPEELLLSDDRSTRLQEAIAKLPDGQRDVLLLKLESGLDLQTIAEVTGVSKETAKSRLRYAVAKLKLMQ
jgi:RNA polymerase sigma-70 factor (ECF subfamily)